MSDSDKVSKIWLQTKRLPFLQEKFNKLTAEVDELYGELFGENDTPSNPKLRDAIAAKNAEMTIVTGQIVEVRYLSEGGFTI